MSQTMKLGERVTERRLRTMVEIGENQFGFISGKSIMKSIFALRQLTEKYRAAQKILEKGTIVYRGRP